ncbi:MAG: DUF4249 family protein [Bacteroidetes bacterium]|nr:DUF4249 family protein [Bacteroidota bacterium]
MLESFVKIPVIEAIITSKNEAHTVVLSYSTTLNHTGKVNFIENASVKVWTEMGDTIIFYHLENGEYQSKPFAAEADKQYTLCVENADFKATSITKPCPVKQIDSLYCKVINPKDSTYHVFLMPDQSTPIIQDTTLSRLTEIISSLAKEMKYGLWKINISII